MSIPLIPEQLLQDLWPFFLQIFELTLVKTLQLTSWKTLLKLEKDLIQSFVQAHVSRTRSAGVWTRVSRVGHWDTGDARHREAKRRPIWIKAKTRFTLEDHGWKTGPSRPTLKSWIIFTRILMQCFLRVRAQGAWISEVSSFTTVAILDFFDDVKAQGWLIKFKALP